MPEIKEITNEHEWEEFVGVERPTSILQSWHWRNILESEGRRPRAYFILDKGSPIAAVLVGVFDLPFGNFYLYAPRGPVFKSDISPVLKAGVISQI